MRTLLLVVGIVISAALSVPATASAQEMTEWWQATARLTEEKHVALACARTAKRLLPEVDGEAYREAERLYDAARTPMMAAIAALRTALLEGRAVEQAALAGVEPMLQQSGEARATFCGFSAALDTIDPGTRNRLQVLQKAIDGLVTAGGMIADMVVALANVPKAERDPLTVRDLRTDLRSAEWPPFAEIQPAAGN